CEQEHAVGYRLRQDGREPTVARGEESREVIVVGQVVLIVIPHSSRRIWIDRTGPTDSAIRSIEEVAHGEHRAFVAAGRLPCRISTSQRYIVMALIPGGGQIFRALRLLMERLHLHVR